MNKIQIRHMTYEGKTLPEGRAMGKDAESKLYWGRCCYHGIAERYTSSGHCVKCTVVYNATRRKKK